MEERQSRNSLFVSPSGLVTLLFFAVLANYFHAWLISAFLLLFFLLCLSSYVWSRGVCKRIEISLDAEQNACYAGEEGVLKLRVRSRSFFPLVWLDVVIPTGERPVIRQKGTDKPFEFEISGTGKRLTGLRERFVWMLWQQEIAWDEEYTADRRGTVTINGIYLQAGDGFGLSAREEQYPLPAPLRLLVYPKRIAVQAGRLLRTTQEETARNYGQTEDITVLKSSRPYQTGDPMKKINWRLLAASGRMITNLYETVQPGCVAFVLDLESFRRIDEKKNENGNEIKEVRLRRGSLERMLSVTAACMDWIAARRIQPALIVPGYGRTEAAVCAPQESGDTLPVCMEALAMIDYRAEDTVFPQSEFWRLNHKAGMIYFCTRTDGKNTFTELASELGRNRAMFLALERTAEGGPDWIFGEDIGAVWSEEEEVYERIS